MELLVSLWFRRLGESMLQGNTSGRDRHCATRAAKGAAGDPRGASRHLDRAADPAVPEPPARPGRGSRARQGMAARLLEASAAAVAARRSRLSPGRPRRGRLPARPPLGGRLSLRSVVSRAQAYRTDRGADRRRRARRRALLSVLGREIRARPDAAAVLGADRAVSLSRPDRGARARLVPRRRDAGTVLLVEIRGVLARRQHRPVPAARQGRAPRLAHAGSLADGARVPDRDRAQYVVARRL